MKKPRAVFASKAIVFAAVAAIFLFASYGSTSAATVEYFPLRDIGDTGIGFLADGSTLYTGGCGVFELDSRQFSSHCRYPKFTHWAKVSPDGKLVFATTTPPGPASDISYQLDALTGKVISRHVGDFFIPPVEISPDNRYWISVMGGRNYESSETLVVYGRDWKIIKKGIYGGVKRVFTLDFLNDNKFLIVNGGGANGGVLNVINWKLAKYPAETRLVYPFLARSHNSKFAVRIEEKTALLIRMSDDSVVAEIDLNVSSAESEAAFSHDDRWLAIKGYRTIDKKREDEFALVRVPE